MRRRACLVLIFLLSRRPLFRRRLSGAPARREGRERWRPCSASNTVSGQNKI
ncbi:unnamed protein product [Spirodela intermedia]|uniref:Uncharacterized protein n=1 Tax=Spirodela intermedia TaxID=51605 RepID=A0A7I8KNK6_SPIIN|nr:unnamed protein product [Spirodela intermedia]